MQIPAFHVWYITGISTTRHRRKHRIRPAIAVGPILGYEENLDRPMSSSQSNPIQSCSITTPNQNDVLFTGGKVVNHVGNHHYRNLISDAAESYDSATDEMKSNVVSEIIVKIHQVGGRFLRKQRMEGNEPWEEVPIESLQQKIRQAFRNRRRRSDAYRETAIPIVGKPLPTDVIFGRAQKNQGSELLQGLIAENFEKYESLTRGAKMRMVEGMIRTIKDQGGRFLEPAPEYGRFMELPHENARERVSTYFRNYRRKK